MSDTVHFLPRPVYDDADFLKVARDIPCGIGRKDGEFVASPKRGDVDCPKCLEAIKKLDDARTWTTRESAADRAMLASGEIPAHLANPEKVDAEGFPTSGEPLAFVLAEYDGIVSRADADPARKATSIPAVRRRRVVHRRVVPD